MAKLWKRGGGEELSSAAAELKRSSVRKRQWGTPWKVIAIAAAAVALIGVTFWFSLSRAAKPDYVISLMTGRSWTDNSISQFTDYLCQYGEDLNGDGTVRIRVKDYAFPGERDLQRTESAAARLSKDSEKYECVLYFHDESAYDFLRGEFADLLEAPAAPWKELAAFSGFEPQPAENDSWTAEDYRKQFEGLSLSLRPGPDGKGEDPAKDSRYYEACQALYQHLKNGEKQTEE